jgi:hypothetical protein
MTGMVEIMSSSGLGGETKLILWNLLEVLVDNMDFNKPLNHNYGLE